MAGKKRGQNEGTIYKRKDGRWEGAVTLPGTGGKRKRFYGDTQREVREQMTATLRSLDQGQAISLDRQTVGQFLDKWLSEVARPKLRPSTFISYQSKIRNYLIPALGKHQLVKLTPQHVQAMMNEMSARGLSPRSVQYARAVLRKALNQAMKWGLVTRNVATLAEPPRVTRPEMQILHPDQARHFLETVKGDRLEALYAVALSLGLRQGEALGLRWQDIDLDAGTLQIRSSLQWLPRSAPELVEPKTRQSRRNLAVPPPLIAQLKAHRARQKEERLLAGPRWRGEEWKLVFPNTIGGPFSKNTLHGQFKRQLQAAMLPNVRFHDLRHSCASLLLAQGVHPRVVMEILGHSTIALTMNIYSHVLPQTQREALDTLTSELFTPIATAS